MQRKLATIPVVLPSLERLRSADLLLPLILILSFVLPIGLAFLGVGIRRDLDHPLLINEVFVTADDQQATSYIKLLNTTDEPMNIDGLRLSTATSDVLTLRGTIAAGRQQYIPVPAAWNAQSDALILRGIDGTQIDEVHWGAAPQQASPIINWSKTALRPLAPGMTIVRNPRDFDSDSAKDWSPPVQPTGRAPSPVALSSGVYRILFDVTNYVSLIAGFLLWGAFILIGLIAKRFEMLTGQRSFWTAMTVAPIGIVVYNIVQSYAFFTAGFMTTTQQFWAFTALLVSAAGMAYVVFRFYGIARRILEV